MSVTIPLQYQSPVTDFSTPGAATTSIRATFRDDQEGITMPLPIASIQRGDDKNYSVTVVTSEIPKFVTKGVLTLNMDQGHTKSALTGIPAAPSALSFPMNRPEPLVPRFSIGELPFIRTPTEATFEVGFHFPAAVNFTDPNLLQITLTDSLNRVFNDGTLRSEGRIKNFTLADAEGGEQGKDYILKFVLAYGDLSVYGINTGTITATFPSDAVADSAGRGNLARSASTLFQLLATPLSFDIFPLEGTPPNLTTPATSGGFIIVDGEIYVEVQWNHPVKLAEHNDANTTANFGMDKLDIIFFPLDNNDYAGGLEAGLLPKNPASGPGAYDFVKVNEYTFRVRLSLTEWQILKSDLTPVLVTEGLLLFRVRAGESAYKMSYVSDPLNPGAPVVQTRTLQRENAPEPIQTHVDAIDVRARKTAEGRTEDGRAKEHRRAHEDERPPRVARRRTHTTRADEFDKFDRRIGDYDDARVQRLLNEFVPTYNNVAPYHAKIDANNPDDPNLGRLRRAAEEIAQGKLDYNHETAKKRMLDQVRGIIKEKLSEPARNPMANPHAAATELAALRQSQDARREAREREKAEEKRERYERYLAETAKMYNRSFPDLVQMDPVSFVRNPTKNSRRTELADLAKRAAEMDSENEALRYLSDAVLEMGKAAQSRKAYRAEKRALNEERRARRAEKEAQKEASRVHESVVSVAPGPAARVVDEPGDGARGAGAKSGDRANAGARKAGRTGRGTLEHEYDTWVAGRRLYATRDGRPGKDGRAPVKKGERKSIAALIKQGGRVCGERELDNETFLAWRNIEHYLKGRAHSSMNAADYAHLRAEHKYGAELLDQFRKGNFWPGAEHLKQVCLLHRETPSSREYAKGKATAEERARKANERADERMTRIREAMAAAREAIEDARDPTEDPVTTSAASEGYDDPDDPDDPDEPYADERIEIANPAADPARHNADASYYRRASSRSTSKSRSTRDDAPGARRTGRRGPINPWSKTPTRRRATGARTRHRRP
eukprot:jgi/Mesvir1/22208/Mv06733-RA.1